MTTFDNREKAAEAGFVAQESAEFGARARRDRFIGHWAAGLLGLNAEDAKAYAKSLVSTDLEKHGDSDVIDKLKKDFAAKGVEVATATIERMMAEKMQEARDQLKAGR